VPVMRRTHAFLIALVLAAAVILGSFAAIRSSQLSAHASTPHVDAAQVARQSAALNRAEAALRSELRKRPPAIPALPAVRHAAAPQTVVYKRAPTIVHVIHRHGGENEHEGGNGSEREVDD